MILNGLWTKNHGWLIDNILHNDQPIIAMFEKQPRYLMIYNPGWLGYQWDGINDGSYEMTWYISYDFFKVILQNTLFHQWDRVFTKNQSVG